MVNRPLFVGAIGAVIVGAAIALTTYFEFQPGARPQGGAPVSASADVARSGPPTQVPPASAPELAPADSASKLVAPEISEKPIRPSFDIVRVNREGDAVIAGRAAPNAEVTVTDGASEIGKVKADSRGEWVLVPSKSLPAGPHELSLEAKLKKKEANVAGLKVADLLAYPAKQYILESSGKVPPAPAIFSSKLAQVFKGEFDLIGREFIE